MVIFTCIARNCTSSSRNNEDLKFHHIPWDVERRTEWILACNRTDLLDKPPNFFRNKHVCSLHFSKHMYKNKYLQRFATPSLRWTTTSQDSCTQTWESIKFLEPTPDLSKIPAIPDFKKMEVKTSHAQTEELILCAEQNLKIKKENEITDTPIKEHNMQFNELEIKSESQIREDVTEPTHICIKHEVIQISSDSEEESMDNLKQINEGLEKQIGDELKKNNIPQTRIEEATTSREIFFKCHKRIQTDDVFIFEIPKNNQCFQQCLRCGKNASRLAPKRAKPEHLFTLEDFEFACERFLTPEFCASVKHQIQIEQQLKQLHNIKNIEENTPLHDA